MIPGALGLEAEPKWGNGSAPREGVQGVQGWVGQMLSKNVTSAEDKIPQAHSRIQTTPQNWSHL